ncbi:MAG: LysE family translocator [Candidatus Igneacidithiobacillus chanchocoensis]
MSLHLWLLYVATVLVISGIPGPNMLLVMSHGALHGLGRSVATMFGCFSALLLMMVVSVGGLGLFLQSWPRLFALLRIVGALYLVYLGVSAWRQSRNPGLDPIETTQQRLAPNAVELYKTGFLVAMSNPKALLFTLALVPQFMRYNGNLAVQFTELVLSFAVIEFSWYVLYSASGARLARLLHGARAQQRLQQWSGGIFVLLGLGLLLLAVEQVPH